jgi:protoheme IX farnesyltransferase
VFVYTLWLKRTTANNVVIGGAAGAAPALIGWSAATGRVGWPAVILFAVVFLWTPPHTWALAIRYRSDYAGVDVPMLPVVVGRRRTAVQMVVYSVLVWAASLALWPVADMGWIYGGTAIVTGGLFTGGAVRLLRDGDPESFDRRAIRYFAFSITYLTLIFAAVAVDQLVRF